MLRDSRIVLFEKTNKQQKDVLYILGAIDNLINQAIEVDSCKTPIASKWLTKPVKRTLIHNGYKIDNDNLKMAYIEWRGSGFKQIDVYQELKDLGIKMRYCPKKLND